MNVLLSNLAGVCSEYLFTPKLLIVDSKRSGHQLLEALAKEGVSWLNLNPAVSFNLAGDIARDLLNERKMEVISDGQILYVISEILKKMKNKGELVYFSGFEDIGELAAMLKSSLLELRMADVSSHQMSPEDFVNERKGCELKLLLEGYERILSEKKLADPAAVYSSAFEMLTLKEKDTRKEYLYLIPENLELDYITFQFINYLTWENRIIMSVDNVSALNRPRGFYFQPEKKDEDKSPYSCLYDAGSCKLSLTDGPEIFHAYGAACEVREVFRRIKRNNIPADKCIITYTDGSVYMPLILTTASACNIPVTFAEGIPVSFTRPGRLLFDILSWIENNYADIVFYRMFTAGCIKVSSEITLAKLLRKAGIGWGRDRYLNCLTNLEKEVRFKAKAAEEEKRFGLYSYLLSMKKYILELQNIAEYFLKSIPSQDKAGEVDFNFFCTGLMDIIKGYAPEAVEVDKEAKESILEILYDSSLSFKGRVSLNTAVKRIRLQLDLLKTGAGGFEPGHLHVASLRRGEWTFRPYVFLVGLDDGSFPGSGMQDPVFLDGERAKITPNLALLSDSPEKNIYKLNSFLASQRGSLTLSFSSYNPSEGRDSFPSAVLLQVFRLKKGNPEADYSTLMASLEKPAAYFPVEYENSLSEEEWWASLVLYHKRKGDIQNVRSCYPGINAGLYAEEARISKKFTEFDGKVSVDTAEVDPRKNLYPLSVTNIERFAFCPFAYFMRCILKVEPPEEYMFDPGRWLDPLSRGLLLHKIFADFLEKMYSSFPMPSAKKDLLIEVAEGHIEKAKQEIPIPNTLVFEYEKTELFRDLEVFLRVEEELLEEGSSPKYFEVPFGIDKPEAYTKPLYLDKPVEIKLPDKESILLRGRIDRIDSTSQEDIYRVWDFKTGSTYEFDESSYIKQGRQIQHALYAYAAEGILGQEISSACVKEAGYIFPTEKGEGQRYLRCQSRRSEALYALKIILDLLSAGIFCAADDQSRCSYCDYQSVCRYPDSVKFIKEKLLNAENKELNLWKELQKYD